MTDNRKPMTKSQFQDWIEQHGEDPRKWIDREPIEFAWHNSQDGKDFDLYMKLTFWQPSIGGDPIFDTATDDFKFRCVWLPFNPAVLSDD